MALNKLGLGFVFTAKDMASGTFRKIEGQFGKLEKQTRDAAGRYQKATTSIGQAMGVLAAGGVALGVAFSVSKAAGEFEQGLAAVGAVTKATAADMAALEEAATQAGIKTQFSPKEAVDGLTSLATAGQTATQATKTLVPVLDLAAGSLGGLGVAEAAEAVVGTLNSYQISADKSAQVTDKLLRITQMTNFQAKDFAVGLSKAAAAGATFGTSLDDTLITVGQLRNANIDASSASTSFREATRRLFSDQNVQQKVMAKGVKLFDDTTGKARSTVDVLLDMAEKTADMTEKEKGRFVAQALGARGLLSFNAIAKATFNKTMPDGTVQVLKGRDAIAELRKELANSGGTAEDFKNKLLDTFEGQKTLLSGTLDTIKIVVGKAFAKVLKPLVAGVVEGLNRFIKIVQATPEPIKKMVAGVVVFTGTLLTLAGAIMVARIGLRFLKRDGQATVAALVPIVGFLAVAAAGFAVFKLAYERNLGGFADFVDNAAAKVGLAIDALAELFTTGGITESAGKLMEPGNESILAFVEKVSVNMKRAEEFVTGFADGVSGALSELAEDIQPAVDAFNSLTDALGLSRVSTEDAADSMTTANTVGLFMGRLFPVIVLGVLAYKGAVILAALATKAWKAVTLVWQGVMIVVTGLQKGWTLATKAYTAASGVAKVATIAMRGAAAGLQLSMAGLLGTIGAIVAAFAAGWAIGTWIDETLGLSDAISDLLMRLFELEDALPKTKKRGMKGEAGALDADPKKRLALIAKQQGKTLDAYLDEQSARLAKDSFNTGGVDAATIRKNLAEGKDPFTGEAPSAPPAATSTAAGGAATAENIRAQIRNSEGAAEAMKQERMLAEMKKQNENMARLVENTKNQKIVVDGVTFGEVSADAADAASAAGFGTTAGAGI